MEPEGAFFVLGIKAFLNLVKEIKNPVNLRLMKIVNQRLLIILTLLCIVATVVSLQSFRFNSFRDPSEDNGEIWPTKRELRRKLWQVRKMLVVYGTGNPEYAADYRKNAEKNKSLNAWLEVIAKPDSSVTLDEVKSLPLLILGTPSSNSLLHEILDLLPINFKDDNFSISRVISSENNDVVSLRNYPNPLNRSVPLNIITGNNDASIVEHLSNRPGNGFRAGEFVIFRDGQVAVWGLFKPEENGAWEIDPNETRNYLYDKKLVLETEHYDFYRIGEPVSQQKLKKLAAKRERLLTNLISNLNLSFDGFPKIKTFLYESLEDKGLMTHNTDLSHFNLNKWEVHAVFNGDLDGSDFYSDAKMLITKFIGESKSPALRDGLGMYFSEDWGKHGYRLWVKRFYNGEHVNPLGEILDSNTYNRESYLFMRPLAGSFVDFLIDKYGWSEFIDLYKRWPESGLPNSNLKGFTISELEQGWRAHIENMEIANKPFVATDSKIKHPSFQKGFCYAHEGYQIYNGYISRKSAQSLKELGSLGTEWISLTPFGYLRDRNKPAYFGYSFGPGSENDESLITAFLNAKKLDMGVMLKPHILMSGPHWGWPGDIKMKSEQDWQKFFKFYTSWIRHYALLAEMYGMDILCIGVELMHTTKDHQEDWRDMIARLRKIYSGQMVYAANWYQEFEQITFWDDLDYIGLNLYYPLSNKDTATLAELRNGMDKGMPVIENVIRKYNKPLLLTEVGFTSTKKPWETPHQRNRGQPVYLEDQAVCYQAIFESFWGKDWFFGIYWWKWPTYLEYGGRGHSGFTPNGKPAEKVVKAWYSRRPRTR